MDINFFYGKKRAFRGSNKDSGSVECEFISDDNASECNFEDDVEDESIQCEMCMSNMDIIIYNLK